MTPNLDQPKIIWKTPGNIIRTHAGNNVYIAVEKLRRGFYKIT